MTSETPLGARAPGKLLLLGEYAVLFGAPALVTAVDRYAEARFTDDVDERPRAPEPAQAVAAVEALHGTLGRGLRTDVSALRTGTMKLGLGSSAAATAAAAYAAFQAVGVTPAPRALFDLADAAHRAVQPGGSGVDVAASSYGGTLRFSREGDVVHIEPVALPSGLVVRVVFTGRESSTPAMLASMRAFEASSPDRFAAARDALVTEARRASRPVASPAAFVEAAGAYGDALRAFGEVVGIPIVEDAALAIDRLARANGGHAKPSGAGGGDVSVAFFAGADEASRFDLAAEREGLMTLALAVDARGPHLVFG